MNIQSLTIQFDAVEDRMVFVARSAEAEQRLLLTRRLVFELLSFLARQLQQTETEARIAPAGMEQEVLAMKHVRALEQVRHTQGGKPAPPVSRAPKPACLVTKIELQDTAAGRLIVFHDLHAAAGRLMVDPAQQHWLVGRLAVHARRAGWGDPLPLPAWLEQSVAEREPTGARGVRSFH